MTQTITTAWRGVLHHMSDRLLTAPTGRSADARSNKTILVGTRQSVSIVSYSGDGGLEDNPTDARLARAILGAGDSNESVLLESLDAPHVGVVIDRIQSLLNQLVRTPPEHGGIRQRINVLCVGYHQDSEGRTGGLHAVRLLAARGAASCQRIRLQSDARWQTTGASFATPELPTGESAALEQALADLDHRSLPPFAATASALERAARRPRVGQSVLDLRVCPTVSPQVEVRFRPAPGQLPDVIAQGPINHPVSYVPWIVTPWLVSRPQLMPANDVVVGPLTIRVFQPHGYEQIPNRPLVSLGAVPQSRRRTRSSESRNIPTSLSYSSALQSALLRRIDEVLVQAGCGPIRNPGSDRERTRVAGVVDRLPKAADDRERMAAHLAALGVHVLIMTPMRDRLVVGDWTELDPERVAESLHDEWHRLQSHRFGGSA